MSELPYMNNDHFPEDNQQLVRLKKRAVKYLQYALDRKGIPRRNKVLSLAIMLSVERVKAVESYKRDNHLTGPTYITTEPPMLTRWEHFVKAVWR